MPRSKDSVWSSVFVAALVTAAIVSLATVMLLLKDLP
jgi:hypothetical protein